MTIAATVCRPAGAADLPGILALQGRNLEAALSAAEAKEQGFVTVQHELALLRAMNDAAPHIVALGGGEVVAFALVMLRAFRDRIPVLVPMFEQLDTLDLGPIPGDPRDFFVMGQVCVAREHRGTGVFGELYRALRGRYGSAFRQVVTEIAARNTRSLRAHEKIGFRTVHEYRQEAGEHWMVVAWDWR